MSPSQTASRSRTHCPEQGFLRRGRSAHGSPRVRRDLKAGPSSRPADRLEGLLQTVAGKTRWQDVDGVEHVPGLDNTLAALTFLTGRNRARLAAHP